MPLDRQTERKPESGAASKRDQLEEQSIEVADALIRTEHFLANWEAPQNRDAIPESGETLGMFCGSILPQIPSCSYGDFLRCQKWWKAQAASWMIWERKCQHLGWGPNPAPPLAIRLTFDPVAL